MGADLFGSFAESTCAALVIAAAVGKDHHAAAYLSTAGWDALMFPVLVSATGVVACIICGFIATNCPLRVGPFHKVERQEDIEPVLKVQLIGTALVMVGVIYYLAISFLPSEFELQGVQLIHG